MTPFRFGVVASPLHDPADVERIVAPVTERLAGLGGVRDDDPSAGTDQPYAVVVATGGTEAEVLDLLARRPLTTPREPVILVTHRLHNSLPASLEALARLRQDGRHGRIVQSEDLDDLTTTIADIVALQRLRRVRLGLVGKPSEWLVASVPDRVGVRERWGIDLVDVDIAPVIADHQAAPRAGGPVAVKFSRRRPEPSDELEKASALHPALLTAIDDAQVDAVTVRCFDFLGDLATSGCVALAELNDTGTVAGCEGDIAGAVAMLIARHLLDQASWIANPSVIDRAAGRLVLAHCTVAPSLVEDLELHTHFESGIGIGLRGTFAPGPVTLLRIGGRELEGHWFADGEILAAGDAPDLCRTQVTLDVDPERLELLLTAPLGNHIVMVRGHHRDRLERWWHLAQA
ncbi:putative L-fucose isomerase-like protein [Nostocoides australiense Ben110]|uniref:Putative L-fucose isomerase-like protein n=1 Tax=Nostocoides australiense Ben110 TaxID=1193182 RepID=W6JWG9_9MICO|nr:hypothetical protein [Tetrasphaera australiensis]CCH72970.1 putative L-fucose isomerase-like protein [Tetrasphaera australiensis Ben110]